MLIGLFAQHLENKSINVQRGGISLYEILCDKMETPKKRKTTFTLNFKINEQHINIHSVIQRFYVEILNTVILSAFKCKI